MELSGKISIQDLARAETLARDDLFAVATGGENRPYESKAAAYGTLSAAVYRDVQGALYQDLLRDMQAHFDQEFERILGSLSCQVSANTESIAQMSADLSALDDREFYLERTAERLHADLDDLSAFTTGIVVSAILKVANCQLSVKTDMLGIKTDLSVKIL